ncbi:MAG: response regulator [Gemmatimonadota bacterium]
MPTVLVVDDEPAIRRALHRLLAVKGYDVLEAGSAAEGVAAVLKGGVDAVLCDVTMPGGSGFKFYDQVVSQVPELARRVVFLTADAKEPEVQQACELRSAPLLSKLFELELAIDAIRVALILK